MPNISEQDEINYAVPIDYSFKKLETLEGFVMEKPRELRVGGVPNRSANNRFISAAIWLNHNNLKSIDHLRTMFYTILEQPLALAWLDLSFNRLDDISDEIFDFPNIKILYLHGNQMQNLSSVAKLRKLARLKKLTTHGNPLASIPLYRSHVINLLPQIINLDFASITPEERRAAPPVGIVLTHQKK